MNSSRGICCTGGITCIRNSPGPQMIKVVWGKMTSAPEPHVNVHQRVEDYDISIAPPLAKKLP